MLQVAKPLFQIYQSEMAGVERAKRALWSLLRSYNAQGSAKLTVTTAKGKLKVILEDSFDVQHTAVKATKRPSPSQLRRKERRAADPAVRQRAAEHQAQAAATKAGEVLGSPEKVRASSALIPLQTSPVKDDVREETGVGAEEVAEERRQLQVPEDYEDRANNDLWDWDANQEKVKEAEKLLRDTDRCCFCDFDCPPPSEQENEGRLFGVLESLWDHIELSHPLAYEWLG